MGHHRRRAWLRGLCACLMLVLSAAALAEGASGFSYTSPGDGKAEITGWRGGGTAIDVPGEIDGLAVTSIAAGAFAGQALIENATLPEGLASLGDGAFADCVSLETVHVPAGVTEVGENPFAGCENLRMLDLADAQAYLTLVNGVLFGDGGRRLVFCPGLLPMERYAVPEGTERIDARAFSHCNRLLSVAVPDSVTEIGPDAFEGRINLTLVVGRGSAAEAYARANDIKYTYPDAADWLAD